MRFAVLIALTLSAGATDAAAQTRDTIFVEVGHPSINGRLMQPHAARVRIYRGDTLVSQWLNELTLGDSAGRRVMRWVTTAEPVPAFPDRVTSVLRQTYDARTLAPLGYWSTASTGASDRVPIAAGLKHGTVMVSPVWSPANPGTTEDRVFTVIGDTAVLVEGTPVTSTKAEERRRTNGSLFANWYLLLKSHIWATARSPSPTAASSA